MDGDLTFEAYKNKTGERLARRLISALENKELTAEQVPPISQYILDNIDKAQNNYQLLKFVEHLAGKWPIFADLLKVEEAEALEEDKGEEIKHIETLIDENKIDEAVQAATDANNQIQGGAN